MDEDKKINPAEEAAADSEKETVKQPEENASEEKAEEKNEEIPAAQTEEELNSELETLRENFQKAYDETVEEAQNGPVIQELEEGSEEEEEPEEENTEEQTEEKKDKKPKKKMKKGKIVGIVIAVILCLVIFVPLLAFFVLSVTQPNFSAFIGTYTAATQQEKYEDRMDGYNKSLKYCSGDSLMQEAMKKTLIAQMVSETFKEKDYIQAMAILQQNTKPGDIPSNGDKGYKDFIKIKNQVANAAVGSFEKIAENVEGLEKVPEADVIMTGIDIPDNVETAFGNAAKSIAEGYIFNKTADGIEDYMVACNYLMTGLSQYVQLGGDALTLTENLCLKLFKDGYVFEASLISNEIMDGGLESKNEEFNAMRKSFEIGDSFGSVYDVALKAVEDEKTDKDSIYAYVSENSLADENADNIITELIRFVISGIESENENNLTRASDVYASASKMLKDFKMKDFSLELKGVETQFYMGNVPLVKNALKDVFTDENKAIATEEQKAFMEKAELSYAAFEKISEIISPIINDYYQAGTTIDFKEAEAKLDAVLTEESNDYDKAFVDYGKYIAAIAATGNEKGDKINTMQYVEEMEKLIPDQPFVYGQCYIPEYLKNKNYSAAAAVANTMLAVNIADDFANSIIALDYRVKGDIDSSLQAALRGIEYVGQNSICTNYAAIAYMLKGDMEAAFRYLESMFQTSMNIETCDLILIFNHIYDGEDEEILNSLKELTGQIDSMYKQYGVKSYDDTLAILDDTKTINDVFLAGNYELSNKDN